MIDVDRILADARRLAFPRYPGTPGDARAIELVEAALRDAGLKVERESFSYDIRPAFSALRLLLAGEALLLLAAGWLAEVSPLPAAAALLVALAAAGALLGWSPWLERIYRREGATRTANVVGRRPARGVPRMSLVLLAHHDSKSQNLTMLARGALTVLGLLGALTVAAAVVASLAGAPLAWPGPAGGTLGGAVLLVLSTLRSGNRSPGGVDNAGSVGILFELARKLPARLPADVDLWFLSPGAEEDHMVGAMRWLDAHLDELRDRPLWALNLDGAGIPGRLALLERYGFGRLFSAELSRLARRVARREGIRVRGVLLPPAMGVDAIPFANRGVATLTLASGSLGRAALAVHSAGDVADNLDRGALDEAARLAAGMALELAGADSAPG